ncbi:Calcium-binding protein 39 [Cyanidiococcus yangmingshanensis]|uniref:Calcium-binding protein 39 n=1 Tax=Cyanidiococcus yangmingshanensis TaxID=2690220 RepID=A0A7J7IPE3_9RHOD|nr:Calcium-binding protein 39 [Cyanidiococcus yangmingshanensis]
MSVYVSDPSRSVIEALLRLRRAAEALPNQASATTPQSIEKHSLGSPKDTEIVQAENQEVEKAPSTTEAMKVQEEQQRVAIVLAALRSQLYGEGRHDQPSPEASGAATTHGKHGQTGVADTDQATPSRNADQQLSAEALQAVVYDADLLQLLASSLPLMEFESRKDAVAIFNNILRRQAENRCMQVCAKVIEHLLLDYGRPDVSLTCGMMLREALRHEDCAKVLFMLDSFWVFFKLVQMNNFDVASDAFTTLRVALTRHKKLAAEFMLEHFDRFFLTEYNSLLRSNNYVSKRQGLKLLSELLLDRSNFYVMIRYIGIVDNLKLVMTLMLDPGKSIQFEAFHVFKLIVANPNKPDDVKRILIRNREKLLRYLTAFGKEVPAGNPAFTSEAFRDDLQLVMNEIQKLDTERATGPTDSTDSSKDTSGLASKLEAPNHDSGL